MILIVNSFEKEFAQENEGWRPNKENSRSIIVNSIET